MYLEKESNPFRKIRRLKFQELSITQPMAGLTSGNYLLLVFQPQEQINSVDMLIEINEIMVLNDHSLFLKLKLAFIGRFTTIESIQPNV